MRRALLSLAVAGSLISQQASAQLQCLSPAERATMDVQALRSEMMVLATGCADDTQYNAFVERYRAALQANEHEIDAWFKRHYGRGAQAAHDRFVTELANELSSEGSHLGSDFCPRNGLIFHQAMALQGEAQLASFAAGQNLIPPMLDVCPVEVAQAPHATKHVVVKKKH